MKIGYISDAHGNVGAFEQGLKVLEAFCCEQIFFLGDAIGYIPNTGVVSRILNAEIKSILGNHEIMLMAGFPFPNDVVYQLEKCRFLMSELEYSEISTWPTQRRIVEAGLDIWMMHGAPNNLSFGYIHADTDLDQFNRPAGSITVMGNTHRPFWRCNENGAFFLNPGSCGMPRDCGDLGSVAVLDIENKVARILRFDIKKSTNSVLAASGSVHESVIDLFKRPRQKNLIGEIYV
jgi:predicted phosphodiesterase